MKQTDDGKPILGEWVKVTEGCGSKDFNFVTGQEFVVNERNQDAVADLFACDRAVYKDRKMPPLPKRATVQAPAAPTPDAAKEEAPQQAAPDQSSGVIKNF